ncbi:NLRC3 [Symbiodinium sp. CCMP2592]|nr:NLRC3 [Symbiodinium sp. CCMP2592]
MDDQLFLDMGRAGDEEEPFRPRLQCWDFPGQNDYAQCNLLYFHGRGIYLAFVDVSQQLDDAWRELQFWMWAIAQHADDDSDYDPTRKSLAAPPVLLVATKWSKKRLDEQDLDSRVDSFLDYVPRLKSQLQAGPGVSASCRSKWIYPVENFAEGVETYIRPLRERLNELTVDLLLPTKPDAVNQKPYAGLQSQTYPVAWLRAHDLLTGLGDGMDVTVPRTQLQAHLQRTAGNDGPATSEPSMGASDPLAPNSSFSLKADEPMLNRNGERILVPKGAYVQVLGSANGGDDVHLRVSCTLLELSQVKRLLAGVKPRPVVGEEVSTVLSLLHGLGVLFWFPEEGLKEHVLLAIRKVAVALTRIISLRFWAEKGLQHSEAYRKELLECVSTTSLRRLNTEGLASRDLLERLWTEDFGHVDGKEGAGMTDIMLKIMEQKGLILKRAFKNDFIVPCCLPASILPESAQHVSEVRYLNLEGLVSPAILTRISADLCNGGRGLQEFTPGPPQLFRNDVELNSDGHSIGISLSPALGFQLLRLRVKSPLVTPPCEGTAEAEKSPADRRASMMNRVLASFFECLGIDERMQAKLVYTRESMRFNPEPFFGKLACSRSSCMLFPSGCRRCEVSDSGFLQQRYLQDLSDDLAKVVDCVCVLNEVRPAGSFRFNTMIYPCDVDLEEYVVAAAVDKQDALHKLAESLETLSQKCREQPNLYWGGLKAGKHPTQKQLLNPSKPEVLEWSLGGLMRGEKTFTIRRSGEKIAISLAKALEDGNKSRTAFITVFAKVALFSGQAIPRRFFEITNVIRFGFVHDGQIIPVTAEYDFLAVLDECICSYSFKTPKAMKYVKRLWERAVYLAQRNMAVEPSLVMLKALKPIFGHWVAELAQIAAHAETLHAMLKKRFKDAALSDLTVFRASLEGIQKQLLKATGTVSGQSWERAAASEVLQTLEHLFQRLPEGSENDDELKHRLEEAADLLEAGVECTLNLWLGSFTTAITRPLHEEWEFPSGHLPIGAEVVTSVHGQQAEPIYMCSWNVQDLGLGISAKREGRQQSIFNLVFEMLQHPTNPDIHVHLLCLHGCWPELLEQIGARLTQVEEPFEMQSSGNAAEPGNQQAIIYNTQVLELKGFVPEQLFGADSEKAVAVARFFLKREARQLRIMTAHLPIEPFSSAHRALCDCVRRLHAGDSDTAQIPMLLLGDFGVQEQAIGPLLKHHAKVPVAFIPVPYPTTVFKGSLLPKRTDAIASLSKDLKVQALAADQVVAGLEKHVELLKSRCVGLADWDTDGSFADMAASC